MQIPKFRVRAPTKAICTHRQKQYCDQLCQVDVSVFDASMYAFTHIEMSIVFFYYFVSFRVDEMRCWFYCCCSVEIHRLHRSMRPYPFGLQLIQLHQISVMIFSALASVDFFFFETKREKIFKKQIRIYFKFEKNLFKRIEFLATTISNVHIRWNFLDQKNTRTHSVTIMIRILYTISQNLWKMYVNRKRD